MTKTATQSNTGASPTATRKPTGTSKQISAAGEATTNDNAIRERAYLLWEKAGSPPGDGINFWLQAEQELQKESR